MPINQAIASVSVVVNDYDEAIKFYVETLGFRLVEDRPVPEQNKRWVVVTPPGEGSAQLVLAKASDAQQRTRVGNQTGGRVFLFLNTDDFWRDYEAFRSRGVEFMETPREESYATVAVFKDLYGNLWDLLQTK